VALACTTLIGSAMAADMLFAGTQTSLAANVAATPSTMAQQVADALHRAGLTGLNASVRGNNVVVHGMVDTVADNDNARRIFGQLAGGRVVREYDIAQEDVDNLQQTLAPTGAQVAYAGGGVFRISGKVQSRTRFDAALDGVRPDLDANVKHIQVDVVETLAAVPGIEYSEMVDTGGVRYIETPDGTKHLYSAAESGNRTDRGSN
jgi:type III secretion protein D